MHSHDRHGLCKQARLRVQSKGWTNVHVVEGDACTFEPQQQATAVTFSYSLSSELQDLLQNGAPRATVGCCASGSGGSCTPGALHE